MTVPQLLVLLALSVLVPGVARAHALRLSTGEVTIDGRRVQAVLQFARAELDVLRPEEIPATVQVSSDGAPCVLAGSSVAPVQEDGVAVTARWDCPRSPGRLRMALGFLGRLPEGHLHVALVRSPAPLTFPRCVSGLASSILQALCSSTNGPAFATPC